MEKIILKDSTDLEFAINVFGKEYESEIKQKLKEYPSILIGNYSEDIEFGNRYVFTIVRGADFNGKTKEIHRD
jgi:hypothetical protein